MTSASLLADPWLSNLLERSAYHVPASTDLLHPAILPSAPAFVDAKVGVSQVEKLHNLENLGFRLIDTNLQLSCQFQGIIDGANEVCRLATLQDEDDVTTIASQAFEFSRFHLDPKIPNVMANHIKAIWAKNFFTGKRGDWMIVVEDEGKVGGFMQLLQGSDHSLIIDLLAVAPECRGKGFARAMIFYAANACLNSSSLIKVGTQIANFNALKLYMGMGFRVDNATYVLHFHV